METSINTRIKAVRKAKKMSQSEFGKAIFLKQGAISRIEQEGVHITEKNIAIICKTFRVRREWLYTGEGEMFKDGEHGIFAEFAKEYELSLPEQQLTRYLFHLSYAEREQILNLLEHMNQALQEGRRMEAELHCQADEAMDRAEARAKIHDIIDELFVLAKKDSPI